MKLILCRNSSLGSMLLRTYMGSRWSHAAIWDEERGTVYDSTMLQGGVKVHDELAFFAHYPVCRDISMVVNNPGDARAWLDAQVGKPYDWSALAGIFFRTSKWEDDDRWFCSELAETFRTLFDRRVFSELACRITPYHQDIVA
jgi:uncharacterized protein YycO